MIGDMHLVAIALAALSLSESELPIRATEGDWYISDDTDNNTGERKVSALNTVVGDEFVMISMRCKGSYPHLAIEWDQATFADQAVFTVQPIGMPRSSEAESKYVFEKITATTERGMEASRAVSAQIVADIGAAGRVNIIAHLSSSNRLAAMDVKGTQQAWARVSRHCPVKAGPTPPM